MWRTISFYLRVIYNFLYLPILSFFNGFRIEFSVIQKVSPKAHFSLDKKARIILSSRCLFEEGTRIRASGNSTIKFGEKVYINRNCIVTSHEAITIGDFTTIGPNCCIYDHDHDFRGNRGYVTSPIKIGNNVWIGANVIILKGVQIGDNSVIGAGCIITKDIPDNAIVTNSTELLIKYYKKSED